MGRAKITELRVAGLRPLEDVRLKLDGLQVLIGDNGSGKSSLIEALEIARRMAKHDFYQDLHSVHGGLRTLLRFGKPSLFLGVRVEDEDQVLNYNVGITLESNSARITDETLYLNEGDDKSTILIKRSNNNVSLYSAPDSTSISIQPGDDRLVLTSFGDHPPHPGFGTVLKALEGIEVQLAFEVTPYWAAQAYRKESNLRSSVLLEPVKRVSGLGGNLPSAYHALRNNFGREHWDETLACIQLGLGHDVTDVNFDVDPGGGRIALKLKYRGFDHEIPASMLSDGTLVYLALVAMIRLDSNRSVLAYDEPDLHLHPNLMMRVLSLFESVSSKHPVLLTTHSDRLLDGLADPAASAVLCELNKERATRLIRPDAEALDKWLERYRGLGDIRAAGHESSVLTKSEEE